MAPEVTDLQRQAAHGSPTKIKTAMASAAGTCVENYDFVAYGTAAALYFGDVFFPSTDPLVGTLLSFATLAVGFVMRPLGGAIGGYLADKYGRKPVLVGALLTMGIATVLIGFLPTYETVGILAPILLVTIRMIQGLAFGAEWGGAVMMTFEHAPWKKRGRFAAIPQAGNPLGITLANAAFLLSASLQTDWAWRLPFLASAVLIVVGLVVRMKLEESPEFEDTKESGAIVDNPLTTVIRDDWRNIARVISLRVVESCAYYVTATFLLSYITQNNGNDETIGLTGIVVASLIAIPVTLLAGALTDRIGRRKMYLGGTIAVIAFGFPMFMLSNTGNPFVIVLVFVIGIGIIHAVFTGTQGAWFAELFRTNTRTSGASIGYQVAASISGFAPFLAVLLASVFGWAGGASLYVLVGVIGLVGALNTRETWGPKQKAEVNAIIAGKVTTASQKAPAARPAR
ncbi:MFS transporter [Rhodococcus sp. WMMA185]|uniref:MFS transporter n=1 Tax=Rhodococcus sp. WMMA185 TaxID=679318 RepID=UPI000878598F|nr:MFS transporter [Rhodococcus sp. WMMA185]AOW92521.1 MFS transporter [Rhodococcus sp. WMMA185]